WADVDGLAADVDVTVVECLQNLTERQAILQQTMLVDTHFVGLGLASPARYVDDPRHRLETTFEHPVLERLQVHRRIALRPNDPITIDLTDRAGRRDLRGGAVGQSRQL